MPPAHTARAWMQLDCGTVLTASACLFSQARSLAASGLERLETRFLMAADWTHLSAAQAAYERMRTPGTESEQPAGQLLQVQVVERWEPGLMAEQREAGARAARLWTVEPRGVRPAGDWAQWEPEARAKLRNLSPDCR